MRRCTPAFAGRCPSASISPRSVAAAGHGQPRTARRVAVAWEHEDGRAGTLSYGELQAQADRLSHALQRLGVRRGDRVAIVMPQRPETAVANMAIFQLGAVAMPLSMLFGPDALAYRLQDSGARVAIADESSIANLRAARADCPALQTVLAVGGAAGQGDADWCDALAADGGAPFTPVETVGATTPPCSSTPAAPPARPRAR